MSGAIRLSPDDNVVVAARSLTAGEAIAIDGIVLTLAGEVALGHKIALVPLEKGDKVLKYGMSIGSMTAPAAAGEWVHMHNMESDYMPAHLRTAEGDHS